MAIVSVDVGATCPGGNHVEIIVYKDGVEAYREWVLMDNILPGGYPSFVSIKAGADSLVSGTKAPNLTAWKNQIKSKSVEVPDGVPIQSLAAVR